MQQYGYINDTKDQEVIKLKKLKDLGIREDNIFIENDKITRSKLRELKDIIQENDTLIIIEVPEAVGTTEQICNLIEFSYQKKLVLFLDGFKLDFTISDLKTNAMLEMVRIIGTWERKIFNNRIKKGVRVAKESGKSVGRPPLTFEILPEVVKESYVLYKNGNIGIAEYAKRCNVSRTMVSRYIKIIETEMGKRE